MPKIPQYDSKRQLTGQPPVVQQDIGIATMPGKMMTQAGETLTKVTRVFELARDERQIMEAEVTSARGMRDVITRAANDNNPDAYEKYNQELMKIQDTSSKGIFSSIAKDKFKFKNELAMFTTDINLKGIFRKKQIDHGKAALLNNLDATKDLYTIAPDKKAQDALLLKGKNLIDEAQAAGFIDRENATKQKLSLEKDWVTDLVNNDIAENPEMAKQLLLENYYDGLTPEETRDYLEIIEKTQERNKKRAERQIEYDQNNNAADLLTNPATSYIDIVRAMEDGQINPDIGRKFINGQLKQAEEDPEEKGKVFDKMAVEMANNIANLDETYDTLMEQFANAVENNQMAPDDIIKYAPFIKRVFDHAEDIQNSPMRNIWKRVVSFAKNMTADLKQSPSIVSAFAREFMEEMLKGEVTEKNAEEKAQAVLKNEINSQYGSKLVGIPDEGKIAYDKYGKVKVYKDGSFDRIK